MRRRRRRIVAEKKRRRLRETIRRQHSVLRVVGGARARGEHEFARNDIRSLVQHLKKSVLRVRAGRAPHNRRGRAFDRRAALPDALAVAFHIELLQIRRQQPQPPIVRQHGASRISAKIAMPHAEQAEQRRQIAANRRGAKMRVQRPRPGQKLLEARAPDGDGDRQPDRAPQRAAPAHPISIFENAPRPERARLRRRRRDRDPMRGGGGAPDAAREPFDRGAGVG